VGLHGQDGELVIGPPNSPDTFKATRGPVMTAAGSPAFHFWVFDNSKKGLLQTATKGLCYAIPPSLTNKAAPRCASRPLSS
jgi:hypothetical protein